MSLAGSELARIDMHPDTTGQGGLGGHTVRLVFAVAQVRPAQAPRFGAGDDTAYLTGVVWRLEGATLLGDAGSAHGRIAEGRLSWGAEAWSNVPLPCELSADAAVTAHRELTLSLVLGHGVELHVTASGLRCSGPDNCPPRPSLAC
jgi:hypothetical protein